MNTGPVIKRSIAKSYNKNIKHAEERANKLTTGNFSQADIDALTAAQAKRDRRAAKKQPK